jgi:1,4-dihydroxy-2-naphthoyl-CoA synthase
MEALAISLVSYTEDVKEGVAAFREKRKPRYRGE